jgi:hypothetical protein
MTIIFFVEDLWNSIEVRRCANNEKGDERQKVTECKSGDLPLQQSQNE